jgi:hypothetical protein
MKATIFGNGIRANGMTAANASVERSTTANGTRISPSGTETPGSVAGSFAQWSSREDETLQGSAWSAVTLMTIPMPDMTILLARNH